LCLVILALTGRYLELLVPAKTESGGINSRNRNRKTQISKSLPSTDLGIIDVTK
jgi:hypothetical protein